MRLQLLLSDYSSWSRLIRWSLTIRLQLLLFRFSPNTVFTRPNLRSQNSLKKKKEKKSAQYDFCTHLALGWNTIAAHVRLQWLLNSSTKHLGNFWSAFRIRGKNISCWIVFTKSHLMEINNVNSKESSLPPLQQ